jgi:hypothetical protein
MFFDRPDLSSRYPNRLTGELRNLVFEPNNVEDIYDSAAYTSYRLQLHLGNRRIDPKFRKMRWHLLMGIKYLIAGADIPTVTSGKIRAVCEIIDKFMGGNDEDIIGQLRRLCERFEPTEEINRDRLKGVGLTATARTHALGVRNETRASAARGKRD